MLPSMLTATGTPSGFVGRRPRLDEPLVDYTLGAARGGGGHSTLWAFRYHEGLVQTQVVGEAGWETIKAVPDVVYLSGTYDTLMRPTLAYTLASGESLFEWFDPVVSEQVATSIGAAVTPYVEFDARYPGAESLNDVVLSYILGDELVVRLQRDRFSVNYVRATGVTGARIIATGLGTNYCFQWRITK